MSDMKGTLEEVLAKVWELYVGGMVNDKSTDRFLRNLQNEDGTWVFSEDNISALMLSLRRDKRDTGYYKWRWEHDRM